MPILKKDGSVRICANFKVTLNLQLSIERYPLPRIEEMFSKLQDDLEFSKLNLSTSYQQMNWMKFLVSSLLFQLQRAYSSILV